MKANSPVGMIRNLTREALASQRCGELDRAEEFFEKALAISEEEFGVGQHRTAAISMLLAKVCQQKGKSVEAELLSSRAQEIFLSGEHVAPFGGSAGFWALMAY